MHCRAIRRNVERLLGARPSFFRGLEFICKVENVLRGPGAGRGRSLRHQLIPACSEARVVPWRQAALCRRAGSSRTRLGGGGQHCGRRFAGCNRRPDRAKAGDSRRRRGFSRDLARRGSSHSEKRDSQAAKRLRFAWARIPPPWRAKCWSAAWRPTCCGPALPSQRTPAELPGSPGEWPLRRHDGCPGWTPLPPIVFNRLTTAAAAGCVSRPVIWDAFHATCMRSTLHREFASAFVEQVRREVKSGKIGVQLEIKSRMPSGEEEFLLRLEGRRRSKG